ncbi:hypothetical protein GCM10027403_14950 [Arthrobacter tecti]
MKQHVDAWLAAVIVDRQLDDNARTVARAIAAHASGLSPVSYSNTRQLTRYSGLDLQTCLDGIEDLREAALLAEYRVRLYGGSGGYGLLLPTPTSAVEEVAA